MPLAIERAGLVRVLAIAKAVDALERKREVPGIRLALPLGGKPGEIPRDGAVVRGGVGESLGGEPLARLQAHLATFADLRKHRVVVRGIADDGDAGVVFGGASNHRLSA